MANQSLNSTSTEGKGEFPFLKSRWGKRKLILIIGILLFIIVADGGSYFFFMWGSEGHSKEVKETPQEKKGYLYSMDPLIVNLADNDSQRLLKIKIAIEKQEPKENGEFTKRLPLIRDAFLTILSSKTYKEIYDSEGKKKLKEEMILKANQLLGPLKVKTIYFTEFVIQ